MARQTKSELNDEILDRAAGLFARQGFARTSIQQIAEALGYSKAGLLHHYPSKQALYDAVIDRHIEQSDQRMAEVSEVPPGIERDRTMIESAIDYATSSPGMSAFMHQIEREGLHEDPRLISLGLRVLVALGIDGESPDLAHVARRISALAGVNVMAQFALRVNMQDEFREHILAAAMATLGHDIGRVEGTGKGSETS